MVAITAERNSLANKYATDAPDGTLFSADPGTSGSATNELTGGSPAFARKALSWGGASGGVITSAATAFDIASGSTVAFFGVTASTTLTTADVKDKAAVTSQAFSSQGVYTVTATFTVT